MNTQDIKFEKYFTYESNVKNIVVNIKDDFGYKKKIEYKLPNQIENSITGAFDRIIYGVIKDKIIMRIVGFQNYEIVFDKNLNYKLKAITPENNSLKLSVHYGGYKSQK